MRKITNISGLIHLDFQTLESTNDFLHDYKTRVTAPITLVTTNFQTAGRGQKGNSWESEPRTNLVLSLLIHPSMILPSQMFSISEVAALSVCQMLNEAVNAFPSADSTQKTSAEAFTVKWPNDIYYGDKKIAGILIETDLMGGRIRNAIIGIGININQRTFFSDAPNPISLFQILGKESNRDVLLMRLMQHFCQLYDLLHEDKLDELHTLYMQHLYRRQGFHPYADEASTFQARILNVEPTGHYILEDTEGKQRRYAFKEVSFCL